MKDRPVRLEFTAGSTATSPDNCVDLMRAKIRATLDLSVREAMSKLSDLQLLAVM